MIIRLSLGMERGIALDVDPIVPLCGHMTAEAVLLEVGRDLLIRRIGLEKSPTPAITPQWIIREPTLGVLDHDEPHLRWISSPDNISRSHLPGSCSVDGCGSYAFEDKAQGFNRIDGVVSVPTGSK